MKERNEIEEKYKWDITRFCESDEKFLEEVKKLYSYVEDIKKFEGKLENDNELDACFEKSDEFGMKTNPLAMYISCREDSDQRDSTSHEMMQKLDKLLSAYSEASSYISPEIASFSKEKLDGLLNNPAFEKYKPYIKDYIREKEHILSKEIEGFLSGMGEFLGTNREIFQRFDNADIKFEDVVDSNGKHFPLNNANYTDYIYSDDRVLRKSAFENMNKAYMEHINFLTSNYVASVKERCFFAKKRGYKSALSASIFGEEASETVYAMLIKKVRENIDIVSEYFQIKAKLLNLKDIGLIDRFAPVGASSNEKISFEDAMKVVETIVRPFGEEYVSTIQKAVKERWIDVFPNAGKRGGAYSSSIYDKDPVVLLNFDGRKEYTSVIAHELGHAMHSYFSNKNQTYQTCDYVIFVAEVASTVNEMLLWRYNMQSCKTIDEKIKLYDDLFELVNSTIFRQTMFAEFEAKNHEMEEKEEPLTKDNLCKRYLELNKFYYGEKVQIDESVQYAWARIPHFFSAFYVYKYATGLICALNLSKKIAEGDKDAIEKYMNFLSSGSSKDPITLLALAGVDLEKEETFDEVFAYLKELLADWKNLIK